MPFKFLHPEIFQGSLRKKQYFEGWYFKHVTAGRDQVYSFIPGISLAPDEQCAFIQVINGVTGQTHFIRYDLDLFTWRRDELFLKVGGSVFTSRYIQLDIEAPGLTVQGRLDYTDIVPYPKRLLSPGIMGWYSFVPFMECKHAVVSLDHTLGGSLRLNGQYLDFSNGRGYIEKDWGVSFPEAWIWLQCNTFNGKNVSLFVSIAKIPWLGGHFIGFICFAYIQGRFFPFATYNKSHVGRVEHTDRRLALSFQNRDYTLEIEAVRNGSGELKAPRRGTMSRVIKESVDSEVDMRLLDRDRRVVFADQGTRAGLEIIEAIFPYLT